MNKIHRLISWTVAAVVLATATVALVCPTTISKISMVDDRAALCAGETAKNILGRAPSTCAVFHSTTLNQLAAVVPTSIELFILAIAILLFCGIGAKFFTAQSTRIFDRWRSYLRQHASVKYWSTTKLLRWFARLGLSGVALTV